MFEVLKHEKDDVQVKPADTKPVVHSESEQQSDLNSESMIFLDSNPPAESDI